MKRILLSTFLFSVLAIGASTTQASPTGFDLGDASNYGVLYQGNGGKQLNINTALASTDSLIMARSASAEPGRCN